MRSRLDVAWSRSNNSNPMGDKSSPKCCPKSRKSETKLLGRATLIIQRRASLSFAIAWYFTSNSEPTPSILDHNIRSTLCAFAYGPASSWTRRGIRVSSSAMVLFLKWGCNLLNSMPSGVLNNLVQYSRHRSTVAPSRRRNDEGFWLRILNTVLGKMQC